MLCIICKFTENCEKRNKEVAKEACWNSFDLENNEEQQLALIIKEERQDLYLTRLSYV